jgi:hypothetical protein
VIVLKNAKDQNQTYVNRRNKLIGLKNPMKIKFLTAAMLLLAVVASVSWAQVDNDGASSLIDLVRTSYEGNRATLTSISYHATLTDAIHDFELFKLWSKVYVGVAPLGHSPSEEQLNMVRQGDDFLLRVEEEGHVTDAYALTDGEYTVFHRVNNDAKIAPPRSESATDVFVGRRIALLTVERLVSNYYVDRWLKGDSEIEVSVHDPNPQEPILEFVDPNSKYRYRIAFAAQANYAIRTQELIAGDNDDPMRTLQTEEFHRVRGADGASLYLPRVGRMSENVDHKEHGVMPLFSYGLRVDRVEINRDYGPGSLEIDLPSGTAVHDTIRGERYTIGG